MPTLKGGYTLADGVTVVPSVTTVLSRYKESGGLIHWAWKLGIDGKDYRTTRDAAGSSGTIAHEMIECHIRGWDHPTVDEQVPEELWMQAETALEGFKEWQKKEGLEIISTEESMVSEVYRFGGTLDAIGKVGGKLVILDWKSGNRVYMEALAQCAAYRQLWNENHPEQYAVDEAHIVRVNKDSVGFDHVHVPSLATGWRYFHTLREAFDLGKTLEAELKAATPRKPRAKKAVAT